MLRSTSSSSSNGMYKTFSHWPLLALDFLVSCIKMDPQNRLSSDDLLKHNYFLHDRFPQRFVPALREKVLTEFNGNPLLRKYKAEVLMSTDKREVRRASHMDAPRWKINLVEGTVKRKFSCDTVNSDSVFSDRVSLSRSNQKVNAAHRVPLKPPKASGISKLSQSDTIGQTEIQMLEKSLESLSKFSQRTDNSHPLSARKDEKTGSPVALQTPSPPQYQSLQFADSNKSPQVLLHPSINNISFGKEPPKRSPNVLQSINNVSLKTTFNQVPLFTAPRVLLPKKVERNEIKFSTKEMLSNSWLYGADTNHKRKENRRQPDDFTLPNVPGGTVLFLHFLVIFYRPDRSHCYRCTSEEYHLWSVGKH